MSESKLKAIKSLSTMLLSLILLILSTTAFSEEKVYTNDDLSAYGARTAAGSLEPTVGFSGFNTSFEALHIQMEQKFKNTTNPEYQQYLRPLLPGMSLKLIKQLWGAKTFGGSHESNDSHAWTVDTYNYEIGICLYFRNNKLKGWQNCKSPRTTATGTINNRPQAYTGKNVLRENEEVMMRITGCQTLQEALDGKQGNTDADFAVIRHGRTAEEICETIGQGCRTCGELARKIKK